jgi:hypothetical protein
MVWRYEQLNRIALRRLLLAMVMAPGIGGFGGFFPLGTVAEVGCKKINFRELCQQDTMSMC